LGIDQLGYLVPLALNYSDFLVEQEKADEGLKVLHQSDCNHPAIMRKLSQLALITQGYRMSA
jgi:hypothetical protein